MHSGQHLGIVNLILGTLLLGQALNLMLYVIHLINTSLEFSDANESSASIKPRHKELPIILNRLRVSIKSRMVIMPLVKMVPFVLQPQWVFVFNVNELVFLFVWIHLLGFGIGGFLVLRLSCW